MTDPAPRWRPLLKDEFRARVEGIITEIAEDLHAFTARQPEPSACLGGGDAGAALFFHYLALVRPQNPYAGYAQELLERAVRTIGATKLWLDFYNGVSGIAWCFQHMLALQDSDDSLAEVDDGICRLLERAEWLGPYDLVEGLVGYGVYGLERWPRGRSGEILQHVAGHLLNLAKPVEPGMSWFNPPEQLIESRREKFPEGYFDCGVAHGMPAVLPVLAACAHHGIAGEPAVKAVKGGLQWLLSQESSATDRPRFPSSVAPSGDTTPSRVGWCYGDLGVAGLLNAMARFSGDRELGGRAAAIARHAGRIGREFDGIVDCPLCHGSAGAAHIFNRIYQDSGDEDLGLLAEKWFLRLLEMRTPGEGAVGFRGIPSEGTYEVRGFLDGTAGIGLALLAAVSDVPPDWDRVLLMSLKGNE